MLLVSAPNGLRSRTRLQRLQLPDAARDPRALTALAISLLVGPRDDPPARRATRSGQRVRTDGPQTHLTKAGTPTMGGALILVAIAIGTLLWADLRNRFVWIVLLRDARVRR